MKRLFSVAILSVLIATICIIGHFTIKNQYLIINDRLEEAYSVAENGQSKKAAEISKKAEKLYVKAESKMAFFVDHKLIEELGVSISRLKPLADANDMKEFRAECKSATTRLKHILNDEKLTFMNIF